MFARQNALKSSYKAHRENLAKRLEQRLEAARAKGDEALVRLLQAEAQYLNSL